MQASTLHPKALRSRDAMSQQPNTTRQRGILRVGVDKAKSAEKELHALHIASANGLEQAVSCLLEARTEPDIRTKAGLTPLYFAAAWAREGVADCLLAAAAEIDAAASNGWTPLFVAVQRERVDIAKLLLKSRADMNR
ncbi:Ank3, partial [Symbiodinium necroappetens]